MDIFRLQEVGLDHVPTLRSAIQPAHSDSGDPGLGGTTGQPRFSDELGDAAPHYGTHQAQNYLWLNNLSLSHIYCIPEIKRKGKKNPIQKKKKKKLKILPQYSLKIFTYHFDLSIILKIFINVYYVLRNIVYFGDH